MIKLNNRPGLSFNILIVFICILALGVGFLVGNYLLQVISGSEQDLETLNQQQIDQEQIADSYQREDGEESPSDQTPEKDDTNIDQSGQTVFVVQVGAFSQKGNADSVREELVKAGFNAYVVGTSPYKVQVGAFSQRSDAEKLEKELEAKGYVDAFVTY
ncbi:MAG: SPOR domain-containing protein [Halanaerobium sp.]|nr:SPOR domain-containing protein [Halanaerobium sp.]